jgi:nitrogen fixation/metabolism regulation signal transduction histidine kinase
VAQVSAARDAQAAPVWLVHPLPDSLMRQAARLSRGAQLLQALRLERDTLHRSFQATFLVVYLAMAAFVLGLGLWLTSRLTRPLTDLAEGIDAIASGDLGARVPERVGGEIGALVKRFNAMAERLQSQQAELGRLERLAAWRAARDGAKAGALMDKLAQVAQGKDNIMPVMIECVEGGVTVGEVGAVLRRAFGEYQPPTVI